MTTQDELLEKLSIVAPDGATVRELAGWLHKSETTVRDNLKKLVADGRVTKEGPNYAMTTTTESPDIPERDRATFETLQANPKGLGVEDLAIGLKADDYDEDRGWSPQTYMSLRRLRQAGRVERVIVWRVVD